MRRFVLHIATFFAACGLAAAETPATPPLVNAATPKFGARISLQHSGEVKRNAQTSPESTFDGDVHSRCVITGTPYTFVVELLDSLPVEKIGFALSDYNSEQAPKDLLIEFDDGTKQEFALELKRPEKRKPAWQDLPVNKKVRTIKITVNSNHPGEVNWGGLGDVAVWTSADLPGMLALVDHQPNAPEFVNIPPLAAAAKPEKVQMPPRAEAGQHPCLLLTPAELEALRKTANEAERAKEALELLKTRAAEAMALKVEFPDPAGPGAQLKDRGDDLAKQHDTLSRCAGNLGIAYAFFGDKTYADKAREILLGYAERYEQYPDHRGVNRNDSSRVMAQRLSEAMWITPLILAYDYIVPSGVLTEEDRAKIETGLFRPCLFTIHRKEPKAIAAEWDKANPGWREGMPPRPAKPTVVGNWTNFYNLATIMIGATLGDRDLIDIAVWDTKKNLLTGIGEDGMWGEGAVGYQMFALQAITAILEVAARQGIDLWSFDDCRIKMPFDAVFRYAYPDGTCAGINDSGRAKLGDWSAMVYDYAWLRYRDPAYAYIVNIAPRQLVNSASVYYPTAVYEKLPEPERVSYPSTVFKTLGYAILRDAETMVLLDYGRHGGTHGHYDKLNLLVFAAGDELGGEPKMHRYEDNLHGEWTTRTVAHNTLTAGMRSQMAGDGKLLCFEDAGPVKLMRGEAAGVYPGALLDRTVVLVEGALLDLYHARGARAQTWDRTFRYTGALEGLAEPTEDSAKDLPALGDADGYQHLRKLEARPAAEQQRVAWKTPKTRLTVTFAGASGQELFLTQGPDREHVALLRQTGPRANFAAVLQVEPWGAPVEKLRLLDTANPALVAAAFEHQGAETRVYVAHQPGAWTHDGWSSDARVLYVRLKDGQPDRLCWSGGNFAKRGEQEWKLERAGNAFAELKDGTLSLAKTWMEPEASKP